MNRTTLEGLTQFPLTGWANVEIVMLNSQVSVVCILGKTSAVRPHASSARDESRGAATCFFPVVHAAGAGVPASVSLAHKTSRVRPRRRTDAGARHRRKRGDRELGRRAAA